mmetsp:Transcript_14567/g.20302  ORF Transcript_14567/g.20302 Transcript_14567/m.20302 type:complete len:211 (-) Transcript_14567:742-1374(-)|eukprot:CAMPEP_0168551096 /NCGR_PEP_ID=MMETSP0413-20121227/5987_1 /TAXON_ID=136452 /ORGANISM="Filamoeba nolandi, Strain NC-AS-23-1" /LENGTH=210 /DNA_ID=CAMNT_0008581593 /DNA_START=58 /DNA_END=690 /DNA_ORIENTATION=-
MPSSNKAIQNIHFHKKWQRRVKTWFDQPANKVRRSEARASKAARVAPRPINNLRPVIHAPTRRYNMKVRLGRGFTLEELKEAGLNKNFAQTIGIAVDYRRRNRSVKSLKANVQRLKEYRSKLLLFPRGKTVKAGEASKEEQQKAQQHKGVVLPVPETSHQLQVVKLSDVDTKTSAYEVLRRARTDARLVGIREKKKKARDAAAAEKTKDQ